jgi:ribonucleoside-diphosphate reductase subunit M1
LEVSCELAKEHGPYETYAGSPVSKGVCLSIMPDSFP